MTPVANCQAAIPDLNLIDTICREHRAIGITVYCVEAVDHDGRVRDLLLPPDATLAAEHRADLLGGVTVLKGTAQRLSLDGGSPQPVELLAVPYGVWANREVGEMDVWIQEAAERP